MYYLKYRPQTIAEIDNSQVREILLKLLETSEQLPHALLFVGQKGTGKTSAARIFAKSVNCLENRFGTGKGSKTDVEPCNRCVHCKSISKSSFTDVFEMDAASNRGIEEVKTLIRETSFLPMAGRYRVFIIDEAHMITQDGFNALLKTLEEPPKTAIFILATTNPEKLPKTIISRCLKVNFGHAQKKDLIHMLKRICVAEHTAYKDEMLNLIADHADRSFRDAAKLLEEFTIQHISEIDQAETFLGIRGKQDFLHVLEKKDTEKAFLWLDEFVKNGGNVKTLLEDTLEKLRMILLAKKGVLTEESLDSTLKTPEIIRLIKLFMEAYQNMRTSPIESLPLEIALAEFYNE